MLELPDPDGYLSTSEVTDIAKAAISPLPLPGVEGSPLDPGDTWLVGILACVNETSIRKPATSTPEHPAMTLF